jgi:1,4-alpha-glucan branching enzyme
VDFSPEGYQWVVPNDSDQSVLAFLRHAKERHSSILIVCNFTPVPRFNYHLGVPHPGFWMEVLNSDAHDYGGSGMGNFGGVTAVDDSSHGLPCSLSLSLPPLSAVFLKSPFLELKGQNFDTWSSVSKL